MLNIIHKTKFDILIFFLENKNFFLSSKSFRLTVFPENLKKFFDYYFVKDFKHVYWIFIVNEKKFLFIANFFAKLVIFKFLFFYCEFLKFNLFLTIGLGFRKKSSGTLLSYNMNVGTGKWSIMKARPSYFLIIKEEVFCY